MFIQAAVVGWALLLSQLEGQEKSPPPETHPSEANSREQPAGHPPPPSAGPTQSPEQGSGEEHLATGLPAWPALEEARPSLVYEQPILCTKLPPTQQIPSGEYRMQCDAATKRCLLAPVNELNSHGEETDRPLQRTSFCEYSEPTGRARLAEGYRFSPARAEAPPGWFRDEQGRVMQFNFDLHRRVYLGGAWAPLLRNGESAVTDRVRVDFGIQTEFPGDDEDRRLHRLSLLDTELFLGESSLDITVLRYDFSVERTVPLFRITTFIGKPRRFDIGINLGGWVELFHQESITREGTELSLLTWAATHGTLDLWHSEDMVSFIRVRAGPAFERDRTHGMNTLVPSAAVEGDLTLDTDGFHHLLFSAEAEEVLLADRVAGRPLRPQRLKARAGYELILLAINDQPLSLLVDGRGSWRNDIPNVPARWEWSANAGLRISLWAPARRNAPLTSTP